jgi:hypothetical protein
VKGWQAFTGREAVLDGYGRSFIDIAAERDVDAGGMPARHAPAAVPTVAPLDFDGAWGAGGGL